MVSHGLRAIKVSSEWRLIPGTGPWKKCPFSLNRGIPSIELSNRYKDGVNVFPGPNFASPEWRCPLNRGVPKERFHCR